MSTPNREAASYLKTMSLLAYYCLRNKKKYLFPMLFTSIWARQVEAIHRERERVCVHVCSIT